MSAIHVNCIYESLTLEKIDRRPACDDEVSFESILLHFTIVVAVSFGSRKGTPNDP